jgi:4-hydroxy-tetrahydrodipicolinate reductase
LVSVRVAIAGAGGRMGQALIEATLAEAQLALAAALDVPDSSAIGFDAGDRIGQRTGINVTSDIDAALASSDVLIDFTRPEGTLIHAARCASAGVALVAGTTGLSPAQKADLAACARTVPIVFAPNMSVGVNVMAKLVAFATSRLGPAYDVEIVEMHHKHKVDAPSGTALLLGEAAAGARGSSLADVATWAREGTTGPRKPGSIGMLALRGGDVVGEHTVIYAGEGERIEITHRATSRMNFAGGALRAAQFVAACRAQGNPGLYDMADVLGLDAAETA